MARCRYVFSGPLIPAVAVVRACVGEQATRAHRGARPASLTPTVRPPHSAGAVVTADRHPTASDGRKPRRVVQRVTKQVVASQCVAYRCLRCSLGSSGQLCKTPGDVRTGCRCAAGRQPRPRCRGRCSPCPPVFGVTRRTPPHRACLHFSEPRGASGHGYAWLPRVKAASVAGAELPGGNRVQKMFLARSPGRGQRLNSCMHRSIGRVSLSQVRLTSRSGGPCGQ